MLGALRHQQGDHEAAIGLIARAITLDPTNAAYQNNYGLALHALGRFAEALDSFRRALEICPQYPQALANLGMAQQSLGDDEAAMASFAEALKLEPYHADAVIKLAVLLEKLGRQHEAIQLYEEGIRHAPCLEFYVNLGALLIATDCADRAVDPLQGAIRLAPIRDGPRQSGHGIYRAGHDGDALACLRKAYELQPRNADVLKRLAALLEKLGQTDEPIRLYQQALAENPAAETFATRQPADGRRSAARGGRCLSAGCRGAGGLCPGTL